MILRVSPAGVCAGALVGGVGRAAVAALHAKDAGRELALVLVVAALLGITIGALAGATGRPLLGAGIGAALSVLVFLATLPAVALLYLLGAGTVPSLLEMLAVGALAGGIGGAVGQVSAARRSAIGRGKPA
jgi:hypothetical protein